ncbi:MAG TPA: LPS export ABC transporter periplasmic protein LptC [Thiotrichaceae bacterium]|jgi:lipopolysaccharide export system protein LptC|nr:LPS export ABC transporter periplasmic protein LptC [Thiotrichaceae bacterium]HIM07588.1 LPS export ABC transporter periplasmic protein LptC [Gammaproteobacteria bacterium]
MFTGRWKLALLLAIIASVSYWVLDKLNEDGVSQLSKLAHYPDYYMENFTTLTMNQDGTPKNRLNATYIAHYPDDNTSELHEPQLEIFRQDKPPIIVKSDKGWITSNNDVILLSGNVYLHQNDADGNPKLELITEDARILVGEKYAETDKATTLISKKSITTAIGMRAYLQEQRMEFLNNVQTTIEARDPAKNP